MIDFSALNGHQDMLSPGNAEVALLRTDAVQLLTQIDEREQLHTRKVIPLPAGMWNALYRLDPAGVVVKLSSGDNGFEVDFLQRAIDLDIPVPRVLGSGQVEHPTLTDASYFLMTNIANSTNAWHVFFSEKGMKLEAVRQLAHDLGQALAKLHQVHLGYVERFGADVENWKAALTDGFSPDWDNIAPNSLFDGELMTIFKRILQKTDYFSFRDGTLNHGDLNLSNVLVDTETHTLRAVIDPGSTAGMPMFDLAYAAMPWDYGFEFFNAMLDSYRQTPAKFDAALFYTSILVVAYRHNRFHTPAVRDSIFKDILPHLDI